MYQYIQLKHFNPELNLGLEDIKSAWLLTAVPVKLKATVHRGNLVFRFPGSGKRISYSTIRKGLIKKRIVIKQPLELLPF